MSRPSRPSFVARALLVVGVAYFSATCADPTSAPTASSYPTLSATQPQSLLVCPLAQTMSATTVLGPKGGMLSVGGTTFLLPRNAVLRPTEFTLTLPASQFMEIQISATGHEHFVFEKPAIVTVDYSRCGPNTALGSLGAWNVDEQSKSPLEWMNGYDIKPLHHFVFRTGHLSGYALFE